MRQFIKDAIRGSGWLPHVGSHPGTGIVLALVLLTAAAGASASGFIGLLGGAAIGLLFYGPIYLIGAADRARCSDNLVKREMAPDTA